MSTEETTTSAEGAQEPTTTTAKTLPVLRPSAMTSAERRQFRAQGHHLKPIVQIGQAGLSEGVIQATQVALEQHELIKVSINGESPTERKSGAEALAKATGSHVIQVIGRVILLYRLTEKPKALEKAFTPLKTPKTKANQAKKKAKVKSSKPASKGKTRS